MHAAQRGECPVGGVRSLAYMMRTAGVVEMIVVSLAVPLQQPPVTGRGAEVSRPSRPPGRWFVVRDLGRSPGTDGGLGS